MPAELRGMPRRINEEGRTMPEAAITMALAWVEVSGAHPLLTDAVMLLQQARDKVADYIETAAPVGCDGPPCLDQKAEHVEAVGEVR